MRRVGPKAVLRRGLQEQADEGFAVFERVAGVAGIALDMMVWSLFSRCAYEAVAAAMAGAIVVDTRNVIDRDAATRAGLRVVQRGRK